VVSVVEERDVPGECSGSGAAVERVKEVSQRAGTLRELETVDTLVGYLREGGFIRERDAHMVSN